MWLGEVRWVLVGAWLRLKDPNAVMCVCARDA